MSNDNPSLTKLGKFVSFLLIVGLIGLGVYVMQRNKAKEGAAPTTETSTAAAPAVDTSAPELTEALDAPPLLPDGAAATLANQTLELELSEYAGYSGLIVANGGLEPNENSIFFKEFGFKVRIKFSDDECWERLNRGEIGAGATTVDVLPLYGKQVYGIVPALISFSRGADGVIVRSDINRLNALKGRCVTASQFNEADFFIRYLAQEANLPLHVMATPDSPLDSESINLLYCADAFAAGDLFLKDIQSGGKAIAGCVTWAPKTTEVVEKSKNAARLLVSNRNLLIVADILVVNRGLAEQNPNIVKGLVTGLLTGNRSVRSSPDAQIDVLAKAFKWTPNQVREELAKVHLANLPENEAFFSGAIDAAGSFGGIYQSSVLSYGPTYIKNPVDADRFQNLAALKDLVADGRFATDKVEIKPIRTEAVRQVENDPLLTKDIRFFFLPNSSDLDMTKDENLANLNNIQRLMQVSPGSTILLRGHVDASMKEEFRKQGGEAFVRKMALKAMELSKNRAQEVRKRVLERHSLVAERLETVGRGWEEPVDANNHDLNRRVEVQWFTVE